MGRTQAALPSAAKSGRRQPAMQLTHGGTGSTVGGTCGSSSSSCNSSSFVQHDSRIARGSGALCGEPASDRVRSAHPPLGLQQQRAHVQARQRRHQCRHRRPGSSQLSAAISLPRQLLLALVLAVCALPLPCLPGPQLAAATEINSAVSIFGPWDYELREDGRSRCTDMVQRTAELGLNTRTMFLPTLFWVSKHEEGFFEHTKVSVTGFHMCSAHNDCGCSEGNQGVCVGQAALSQN